MSQDALDALLDTFAIKLDSQPQLDFAQVVTTVAALLQPLCLMLGQLTILATPASIDKTQPSMMFAPLATTAPRAPHHRLLVLLGLTAIPPSAILFHSATPAIQDIIAISVGKRVRGSCAPLASSAQEGTQFRPTTAH